MSRGEERRTRWRPDGAAPTAAAAPRLRRAVLRADRRIGAAARFAPTRPIEDGQRQPASLDLRLGPQAYRVRASFLPGKRRSVEALLAELTYDEIDLDGVGAVLERGCVYVIPLLERLDLPDGMSGGRRTPRARPAGSTSSPGSSPMMRNLRSRRRRLSRARSMPRSRRAPSACACARARVSIRSASAAAIAGPNWPALRRGARAPSTRRAPLADGELTLRDGLILRVALDGLAPASSAIARRSMRMSIDVDRVDALRGRGLLGAADRASRKLILDPDEFYILASRERIRIPAHLSAEMMAIDPAMGEFRVHYAGFFDPGFGCGEHGGPGSRAVLGGAQS